MAPNRPLPASTAQPDIRLRHARIAVATCFFLNAVFYANLVPRLPAVKAQLGLNNTQLGTALAALPLGALLAALSAAAFIRRFGSGPVASFGLAGLGVTVWAVTIAPNWVALAAALLVTGALDAVVDVAQNAHGLRVQRLYRRSILNSFHGIWSVGAVTGGLLGSAAAGLGIPLTAHLAGSAVVFGATALLASRWMLPGHDRPEAAAPPASPVATVTPAAGATPPASEAMPRTSGESGRPGRRAAPTRTPWLAVAPALAALGVLAACGAFVEDSGSSWSALYLRGQIGAGAAVAGLAYVALSAAMTIGRLTGDRMVDRYGQRRVSRVGGVLTALGMGLAVGVPTVPSAVIGWALAGLGVATLIPAVYLAADELPGLPHAQGLTVINWLLRIGFLASPPVIGAIADATSLRIALLTVVLTGIIALALGRALPGRRGAS